MKRIYKEQVEAYYRKKFNLSATDDRRPVAGMVAEIYFNAGFIGEQKNERQAIVRFLSLLIPVGGAGQIENAWTMRKKGNPFREYGLFIHRVLWHWDGLVGNQNTEGTEG